jgi:hypothetical protein
MINNSMKLGLDFHGVIDNNPKLFVKLSISLIINPNNEIHIITGNPFSKEFEQHLLSYNDGIKWWTHLYSITDDLSQQKENYIIDENGGKLFDNLTWCKAKSIYCAKHNIDLHIDDRPEYLEHFTTSYTLYKPK